MKGIELAKNKLCAENYTCVLVCEDEVVMTSFERGVKPLMQFFESITQCKKPIVLADKVIGRASALLAVLCGIESIYTRVISEEAKKVLDIHDIPISYDRKVPYIINRNGDGGCPMEQLSIGIDEPYEMYLKVKEFMKKS